MSTASRTFQTVKELSDYLNDTPVPRGSILGTWRNSSGWIDLLYDEATYAYAAASGGGTVSVPAGAAIYEVFASAVGGSGTVSIDGGDDVDLNDGDSVDINLGGRVLGGIDIVFSANVNYYVGWWV